MITRTTQIFQVGSNHLKKSNLFYHESDSDFGIPHITDWAKECRKQTQNEELEIIDQVSKVLKFRYNSPDAAAEALIDKCSGISVSDDLVSKLLNRFGNDYVRAFGIFKWMKMRSVAQCAMFPFQQI